ELYTCLMNVLRDSDSAMRVVFRTRGEERRILIADALMREKFNAIGLVNPYSEAISDMGWCRQIRNQYAHCHWEPKRSDLRFTISRRQRNRSLDKSRLADDLSSFSSYRTRKHSSGLLWCAFGICSTNIFGYQHNAEATRSDGR